MLEEYCQNKGAIPTPWNKALDQALVFCFENDFILIRQIRFRT